MSEKQCMSIQSMLSKKKMNKQYSSNDHIKNYCSPASIYLNNSCSRFKNDKIHIRKCSQKKYSPKIQQKRYQIFYKQKLSDYAAFIKKIGKNHMNELPSAFQLINIKNIKNNESLLVKKIQDKYQDINFKILSHTHQQLMQISSQIMGKYGLNQICGKYSVIKLIAEIQNCYNTVSYHNFSHGFSLMHMFYQLIKMDRKFKSLYTKEQIGFTLVSALAHDIGHRGVNNVYEIKMNTQLAKLAQNDAVLQKMHIRLFFNIIRTKNITFLDKSKNSKKMKQLITRTILATDVSKHFKGLQKLKVLKKSDNFDQKNQQNKIFLLEQVFHACDIGNPCLKLQEYINWAALLTYQFNTQTKLQQANSVEVSQMLRYKGKKQFFEGQIGFINILVYPLWKELGDLWSGFMPLVKNIQTNREELKNMAAKEEQPTK